MSRRIKEPVGAERTAFRPLTLCEMMELGSIAPRRINQFLLIKILEPGSEYYGQWLLHSHTVDRMRISYQRLGNLTIAVIKNNGFLFIGKARLNERKDSDDPALGRRIAFIRAVRSEPILDVTPPDASMSLSRRPNRAFDVVLGMVRELFG